MLYVLCLCLFSFQLFYSLDTLSHLCFCVCFLFSVLLTLMFAFVLFSVFVYAVMSSIFVSVLLYM